MVLFLIGFMGCGKSSIGRKLARRLRYGFVDMDADIEQQAGMTVSEVFAQYGEARFRELEREALARYAGLSGTVVATGGGAPCGEGNMEAMNRCGVTVYFKMTPEKLAERLYHGRDKRPLLQGKDDEQLLAYIRERLPVREKFYGQARLVIDCDGVSDDYIAEHVVRYMENCLM